MYDQLYNYFTNNKIFHQNAMGFRKNRSTLTAILQMYDKWVRASISGNVSMVVLLDLSAAFDLVDPDILLKKLEIYGVHEDCLDWLKTYLLDRKQGVWIDHLLSDWEAVKVGVPQGSILGPLLFVIFANDLPYTLSCDLDMYADDSTMTCSKPSITDINQVMNFNCTSVHKWMGENHLCLNAEKTKTLIVGTQRRRQHVNRRNLSVFMNDVPLQESENESESLLGVQIMSTLKWTRHVSDLKSRLKLRLIGIQKLRYVLPAKKLKLVAEGIFTSLLTYCIPVWGSCDIGDMKCLQVMQNVAARHVLKMSVRSHRMDLFDRLGWLTVNQLQVYHSLLLVNRIRKNKEPEYLYEKLSRENVRGKIIIPNTHLSLARKSFCWRAAEWWNKLPNDVRDLDVKSGLKKNIKAWVSLNVPRFLD